MVLLLSTRVIMNYVIFQFESPTNTEVYMFKLRKVFLNFLSSDGNTGHQKKFLPSVSTSLALATAFGIAQTIALYFGSGFLLNTMGIPVVRLS